MYDGGHFDPRPWREKPGDKIERSLLTALVSGTIVIGRRGGIVGMLSMSKLGHRSRLRRIVSCKPWIKTFCILARCGAFGLSLPPLPGRIIRSRTSTRFIFSSSTVGIRHSNPPSCTAQDISKYASVSGPTSPGYRVMAPILIHSFSPKQTSSLTSTWKVLLTPPTLAIKSITLRLLISSRLMIIPS